MKKWMVICSLLSVVAIGCAAKPPNVIKVTIINSDADEIGEAKLQQRSNGVELELNVSNLPPGEHGMHIHEKGVCTAPDFASAGGHFNPEGKQHGLLNPKGAHAGDLPNLVVDKYGKAKMSILIPDVTFQHGKMSLISKEGTSLVIHERADDGKTDPAGDSGPRIACGVISKMKVEEDK
ncbi:MAG: superoxide dismutase family protein [Bacilli bacterium]